MPTDPSNLSSSDLERLRRLRELVRNNHESRITDAERTELASLEARLQEESTSSYTAASSTASQLDTAVKETGQRTLAPIFQAHAEKGERAAAYRGMNLPDRAKWARERGHPGPAPRSGEDPEPKQNVPSQDAWDDNWLEDVLAELEQSGSGAEAKSPPSLSEAIGSLGLPQPKQNAPSQDAWSHLPEHSPYEVVPESEARGPQQNPRQSPYEVIENPEVGSQYAAPPTGNERAGQGDVARTLRYASSPEKGPGASGLAAGGPWALEASTQGRLIEIREAIKLLQGSNPSGVSPNGVTPPAGGKKKKEDEDKGPSTLDNVLDVLSQPAVSSAGGAQSGSNLASYIKKMKHIGGNAVKHVKKLGSAFRGRKTKVPSVGGGGLGGGGGGGAAASAAETAAVGEGAAVAGAAEVGGAAAAGEAAAVGGLAGPVGVAAGAIVGLGVAAFEAGKATYAFARAQEAEIRKLAEVGPQQAAAVARLDAERTGRDIKTASETGDSSESLISSISKFEDALQPFESALTNLSNVIAGGFLDVFTDILEFLQPIVDAIKALVEALGGTIGDSKKPETSWEFIRDLEKQQEKLNLPKWPQGRIGNIRGGM